MAGTNVIVGKSKSSHRTSANASRVISFSEKIDVFIMFELIY